MRTHWMLSPSPTPTLKAAQGLPAWLVFSSGSVPRRPVSATSIDPFMSLSFVGPLPSTLVLSGTSGTGLDLLTFRHSQAVHNMAACTACELYFSLFFGAVPHVPDKPGVAAGR